MSPSEADLRAALGRGEDEGGELDVDRIVEQGQLHVARRRVRMLSAAAVAAVVGVGVGAYAVRGNDRSTTTDATRRNSTVVTGADGNAALVPTVQKAQPAARPAPTVAGAGTLAPTACPPSRPQPLPPGGNGTPGGARLFSGPVRAVVICSYGPPSGATGVGPTSLTLTGRDATALVSSLENASRTNLITPCPSGSTTRQRVLALIGIGPTGARLPAVTLILSDPACNVSVTNGRTTRYDWTPDPALVARIFALAPQPSTGTTGRPARIPTGRPPGGKQGSPLH